MQIQSQFSPEEWNEILTAPLLTAAAVMAVDLSGISGLVQEGKALYAELSQVVSDPEANPLSQAVVAEILSRATSDEDAGVPMQAEKDLETLYSRLEALLDLAASRVPPEVLSGFRRWLYQIAVATAGAAREGGFLGIGSVSVSDDERQVLARLASILGVTP